MFLCLLLLGALFALGAGPPEPRLLILCVDGLQADAFERLLARGRLPALERLLRRGPSARGRAVSSFPSSTAPSVIEFLTGRFADRTVSAPRSIHAFDRGTRKARRYTLEPNAWEDGTPNLFSLLERRGEEGLSLFEGVFKGATSFSSRRQMLLGGVLEFLRLPLLYNPDRALVRRFERLVKARGEPPRAAFLMLSSVDLAGHVRGPESPRYEDAIEDLDRILGDLFSWMETVKVRGGSYLDASTIALFGDHGMEQSGRFVDLRGTLRAHGLKSVDLGSFVQVAFRERLFPDWHERPDVVLAPGGSNVTQVYFRRPEGGWGDGPAGADLTSPAAELLEETPGVELVLRRLDESAVEVRARGRRLARVVSRGEPPARTYAYVVEEGPGLDPLAYLASPEAASLVHVAPAGAFAAPPPPDAFRLFESWHRATLATDHPAAVPLIAKGCAAGPTQGDLVLTSSRGWSFLRHGRGDHGGLRRQSIETAILFAGPSVLPSVELEAVRLVDLFPTFIEILGLGAEPDFLASLDGQALPVALAPEGEPGPPTHLAHGQGREKSRGASHGMSP